ncbi:MAG: VanZ family protein [archaeon]
MISKFHKYWMPVVVWALIMLFVSTMPGEALEKMDGGSGKVSSYSYIWHFFEFLVLSFLLFRAISLDNKYGRMKVIALVIAVSFAYSFLTEFMQLYVPGRFFDYSDIMVNNIGAVAGLAGIKYRISDEV